MEYIYGKNPVMELISSAYTINGLFLENTPTKKPFFKDLFSAARAAGRTIETRYMRREELTKLAGTPDHQGVLASIDGFRETPVRDFAKSAAKKEKSFVFILDCIHDPHNMGAIIRSSHAMGVDGCVVFEKRSARINSTVAKTSAGAVFHINIIRSSGINEAITQLKEAGYTVLGCEMNAEHAIYEENFASGKHAVILGNEGEGIAGKTETRVDRLIKIPMAAAFDSLNVSVTAGILAYEYIRQNAIKNN